MIWTSFAFSDHWPLTTGHCLAIAFVTPAFFLAGLALASIPIVIHILNRRRYKVEKWAAMEFLLRAMKKNRRRLKFEQWMLLAVRCLVLLLVATALARPMGCRDSTLASLAGQRSGLHVIVIDNSYSMAYEADRPDAVTHLDRAKQIAKQLIDTFQSGGESVAIVIASRPAAALLSPATYDLTAAKSAIDRIPQSFGGTDILGALRIAQDVGQREKTLGARNLYLMTDGTRSAYETADASAVKQLAVDLSKQFHITHFNLGKPNQWNQATLALKPTGNLVSTRLNNDLIATVQAFGQGPDALMQWKLDDAVLPGGGQVRFTNDPQNLVQPGASFKSGGPHLITAVLNGEDRLKIDNTRYRVLDVAAEMKVLIVEGERGMSKLGGSGAFLDLALAPPREGPTDNGAASSRGSDSYVAPEVVSDLELGNKVLNDYRAVILCGVGQISATEADQLAIFVKQGGGLILFMGEPVVADNYNQILLSRGLLPGPLTKRVATAADQNGYLFDFKPHASLHPLLALFAGEEKSGLDTAQVFTYWQIDLKPDAKVERVLDYLPLPGATLSPSAAPSPSAAVSTGAAPSTSVASGSRAAGGDPPTTRDPAITLHTLGQGHIITVTTTANAEWTSFPAKPAYVALMHEMLAGSIGTGDTWMNLNAGDTLQIPRSLKLTAAPTLLDPQQNAVVLEPDTAAGPVAYHSSALARPGVYHLNTGAATLPIAVNVPADEADVRTLDNAAIKKALGDTEVDLQGDALPSTVTDANKSGSDFGWPFMLAVLLFVLAECFMAMRFGHYRRS